MYLYDESSVNDHALREALAQNGNAVAACRSLLNETDEELKRRFHAGESVDILVRDRARAIDHMINRAWQQLGNGVAREMDIVAVGGYGRGELHPGSDIDLLILHQSNNRSQIEQAITGFLTFLWDVGLKVGHSVRTLPECQSLAAQDLTVMTALLEARLLCGEGALFAQLPELITPSHCWPSVDFYNAKIEEQRARHARYHDTAHNLEPNVKSSPGGLRDIQTVLWIAKRHYGCESLNDLVSLNLLTAGQLRILMNSQSFLWKIRFALHLITGRDEDRLLFDHQIKLAQTLGYEDATYTLAVEQLMQRYYRTVMEVSRLNEMLLQMFEEVIFGDDGKPIEKLSDDFQIRNRYVEATSDDVFVNEPSGLLEIFLLLETRTELKGIAARTIVLIKQHLWLIDEEFRQNPRNHRLFLEILRAPKGLSRTLRRMNTYGVLGLYIPAFGRVVGRMQYDLFHAYTVDAHTLFVVENLRRMSMPEFDKEFPHGGPIMQRLEKPEIAYLGGMFHDIAKGRGGDHSELGSVDAEAFCLEHGMSRYDANLVAWLVREHLSLSVTAQKKDLNDPVVIAEFAAMVGDGIHLDYLYALTVADVRGTNPTLWNSWKESLFWDLYQSTLRALRRGLSNPIDEEELVLDRQNNARKLLDSAALTDDVRAQIWELFTHEYYLRHRPPEIAWHTEMLAKHGADTETIVAINSNVFPATTMVMVYSSNNRHTFARTTAALDDSGLDVVDARVLSLKNDHTLDTYSVLDSDGLAVTDQHRLLEVEQRLVQALMEKTENTVKVSRRVPRLVKAFSVPVQIDFSRDPLNDRTVMEIRAADRPGLLLRIGEVMERKKVLIQNAKISTIGERAEDVFFITTYENKPLGEAQCESLGDELKAALSAST